MIKEATESSNQITLKKAVSLLNVSRSGFYRWSRQDPATRVEADVPIREEIHNIVGEFTGYGYRRVKLELGNRGYIVNGKRVLRLMREERLLCKRKRFKPTTTNSDHDERIYPNLIMDMEITRPNQVWGSDITYLRLGNEFVYLAVIMDLYTRRCIGWELGRDLGTQLALNALHMALETRKGESLEGLIHHSDRGVQYASRDYVEFLKQQDIGISMSRTGNPYDNAFVESFIKTLKTEEVYMNEYETFWDALENIGRFIDELYNKKRLHSSLGYKSPMEFEQEAALNTGA